MIRNNIKIKCTSLLLTLTFLGCSVEPTYFSQIDPDRFFQSQDQVYQRFYRPFTHWAWALSGNDDTAGGPRSPLYFLQEFTSDELCLPARGKDWWDDGEFVRPYFHEFTPYLTGLNNAWGAFSMGVAQAWSAMEDIERHVDFDALGFPTGTRDALSMQLQTLVASYYLIALDHFGGVPLYASNKEDAKPRATDKETFEFIEALLLQAIPNLPRKTELGALENGSIHQATGAMLLARLYLNAAAYTGEERYDDCATICRDLIEGKYGSYALADDWTDIFGFTNETCPEILWSIPSENARREIKGGCYHYSTHYNTRIFLGNPELKSYNGFCLTPSLDKDGNTYRDRMNLGCPFSKFEDTDLRKQLYVYEGAGSYRGMFLMGKLVNPITGEACLADGSREYLAGDTMYMVDQIAYLSKQGTERKEGVEFAEENSGIRLFKFSPVPTAADKNLWHNPDVPVIRLAEAYYTLAECKFRAGDNAEAARLINTVRSRYFTDSDPNPVTADNLDEWRLLDEWLIEFLGEGRRRTDLVRWGKFTTESWFDHTPKNKPSFNRFPIPHEAISANNLIQQNPGY
ncbi:MAG: RagB/SusD family nutrient uptake outer membrane protein [Tannerellaceae bacterium]|jgi:hypothetical protein|nr:RagB/SusD family nutrient uptake outer membrane protein [Tannerellaceae bacterium]